MDRQKPIFPPPAESADADAGDCLFRRQLGAFHDGELDEASAVLADDHIKTCAACQAELEDIAELSQMALQIGNPGISRSAVVAIHRAVDADDRFVLHRFGVALTAVAASALIVGATWLYEMPESAKPGPRYVQIDTSRTQGWESVALGSLEAEPLPRNDWDEREEPFFNETKLADAMLQGLDGSEQ